MAFHINPKTGDTGSCKAVNGKCPFGGQDVHFITEQEARTYFEKNQSSFEVDPYAKFTTEELASIEVETMTRKAANKEPLTEEEYDRHYEYIRRIRKGRASTHKTHTKQVKGKATYTAERTELHDAILETLSRRFEAVPNEGKVLLVGGITGSGKSTTLRTMADLNAQAYAVLNPDEIKIEMAKLEMTPKINGLLPLETDELIKYEAQVITDKFFDQLADSKKNMVIDKTLASSNQMIKTFNELKARGYTEFSGVFVDVDPDVAYSRIRNRHMSGVNDFLTTGKGYGERPVPGSAVASTRTSEAGFRSKNAVNFMELAKGNFFTTKARVFDSSNGSKEIPLEDFGALKA